MPPASPSSARFLIGVVARMRCRQGTVLRVPSLSEVPLSELAVRCERRANESVDGRWVVDAFRNDRNELPKCNTGDIEQ